jgi:catechol 2,3-dioxygenase-like lactoylglutathione lyase family enzyme
VDEPLGVRIDCVTVDCADPEGLADFWCALLGYERQESFTSSVRIAPRGGEGPVLLFAPNPGREAVENGMHLDLRPTDHHAAVDHAIALGARRAPWGLAESRWTVLEDPEGNEFCILQSERDYVEYASRARNRP